MAALPCEFWASSVRRLLFLIFLLPNLALAQQHSGRVYDAASFAPIGSLLVTNVRSGSLWLSDSGGKVAFTALPGDVVTFSNRYYKTAQITITSEAQTVAVGMERAPIELAGVEILSPLAKYQRDSAFNRQFFRKELSYAHARPELSVGASGAGPGVGASGLISQLALMASGKRKSARRLEEEMLYLEGLQYSAIRYTPWLVSSQTGLDDSSAASFIIRNPIPNDFLRMASELELKMHIRELYKQESRIDSLHRKH